MPRLALCFISTVTYSEPAASPPDVRKGCAFPPVALTRELRAVLAAGHSPIKRSVQYAESQRLSLEFLHLSPFSKGDAASFAAGGLRWSVPHPL